MPIYSSPTSMLRHARAAAGEALLLLGSPCRRDDPGGARALRHPRQQARRRRRHAARTFRPVRLWWRADRMPRPRTPGCRSGASRPPTPGARTLPTAATTSRSGSTPTNPATACGGTIISTTSSLRWITIPVRGSPAVAAPFSSIAPGRACADRRLRRDAGGRRCAGCIGGAVGPRHGYVGFSRSSPASKRFFDQTGRAV